MSNPIYKPRSQKTLLCRPPAVEERGVRADSVHVHNKQHQELMLRRSQVSSSFAQIPISQGSAEKDQIATQPVAKRAAARARTKEMWRIAASKQGSTTPNEKPTLRAELMREPTPDIYPRVYKPELRLDQGSVSIEATPLVQSIQRVLGSGRRCGCAICTRQSTTSPKAQPMGNKTSAEGTSGATQPIGRTRASNVQRSKDPYLDLNFTGNKGKGQGPVPHTKKKTKKARKNEKEAKKAENEGSGVVAHLKINGKKVGSYIGKGVFPNHAENLAFLKAVLRKGYFKAPDVRIEINEWPCGQCHPTLISYTTGDAHAHRTITVKVTDNGGAYWQTHQAAGVTNQSIGTIVYSRGQANYQNIKNK